MGPFKEYVTYLMTFFSPFTRVTVCLFYSINTPVVSTKNSKLWNERKEEFCLYDCFSVSRLSKDVENQIFRRSRVFRHTCIYKQPMLNNNIEVEEIVWDTSLFLAATFLCYFCHFLVFYIPFPKWRLVEWPP